MTVEYKALILYDPQWDFEQLNMNGRENYAFAAKVLGFLCFYAFVRNFVCWGFLFLNSQVTKSFVVY